MSQESVGQFNIETAVEDFAGPGRVITAETTRSHGYARHHMRLKTNGWEFSVVWGFGAYCTGARAGGFLDNPPPVSPDAEVAVWPDGGEMIELSDDTVEGWTPPAAFLAAVEAAERDDEDGIRTALVERSPTPIQESEENDG